jgi:hypothetical protein
MAINALAERHEFIIQLSQRCLVTLCKLPDASGKVLRDAVEFAL